jgi:hypothetical protein
MNALRSAPVAALKSERGNNPSTLFECAEPETAQKFLWRLRARQRNQILLIILGVLFALGFAMKQDPAFDPAWWKGLASIGSIAVLVRLLVGGSRRSGAHIFEDESAKIYVGGSYNVFEDVDIQKLQKLQISPVSFEGSDFHLVLVIFKHRSGGRYGGVFPVYFCVQNSDIKLINEWARERNVDVEEGTRVTSPNKLPLFIR